jgi:hypothetical protein
LAKAAAEKAIAEFKMKAAPEMNKLALSQAISKMSNTPGNTKALEQMINQMEAIDPARAKSMAEQLVPGVGMATTAEGGKVVREAKVTRDTVKQGVNRLKEIAQSTGKSLSLNDRAEAESIKSALIGRLREPITGPGAMSEGERAILQSMIPSVADSFTFDSVNLKKLDTLQKQVDNSYFNSLKANGLAAPQQRSQADQALQWAKQNPGPKADAILKRLGQK